MKTNVVHPRKTHRHSWFLQKREMILRLQPFERRRYAEHCQILSPVDEEKIIPRLAEHRLGHRSLPLLRLHRLDHGTDDIDTGDSADVQDDSTPPNYFLLNVTRE